ncbi:hypothetical protein ACGFNP_25420 [Nonomuraea sp. NPDC049269]|uniref:hypothetical protein n=1 Tax=Nonomuraea sp. NPDC049269 TaxID=3364349 RepID=UPI0037183313
MAKIDAPPVTVGSVWACNSAREWGRSVEVIAIRDDYAVVKTLTNSHEVQRGLDANERCERADAMRPFPNVFDRVGMTGRIRLHRMRPTANGYRYVTDAAVVTNDALAALFAAEPEEG